MDEKKIYHGKLADFWFDNNGILYAVSKPNSIRTIETLEEDFKLVKKILGHEKVGLILDNSFTKAYDIKMIRFTIREYPKLFKAVAFVPTSPIGKMISSILATLNPGDVMPIEMFNNTPEAEIWIMKHL